MRRTVIFHHKYVYYILFYLVLPSEALRTVLIFVLVQTKEMNASKYIYLTSNAHLHYFNL